jgi:hypothetical protein
MVYTCEGEVAGKVLDTLPSGVEHPIFGYHNIHSLCSLHRLYRMSTLRLPDATIDLSSLGVRIVAKKNEEKPVGFRVFLPDEEKVEFRLECIKRGTNMSDQSIALIREWLASQKKSSSSSKNKEQE